MEEKYKDELKKENELKVKKYKIYLKFPSRRLKSLCCTPDVFQYSFKLRKNPIKLQEIYDQLSNYLIRQNLFDPTKYVIRFQRKYKSLILDYSNNIDFTKMKIPLLYAFIVPKDTPI